MKRKSWNKGNIYKAYTILDKCLILIYALFCLMEKLTYKKVLTFELSDVKIKKYRAEIKVKKQSQKTFEKNLKKF